jgi:hypothetical protein
MIGTVFFTLLLVGCYERNREIEGPVQSYQVTVLNHTPVHICQVRSSHHNQWAWGDNLLKEPLRSGECATVELPGGMHDLQFVPCAENEPPLERYGVIVEGPIWFPLAIHYPKGLGVSVECLEKP